MGIILGEIIVRITRDWIGRRWGIIQDAVIMFTGSILLTVMWGTSLYGWTIMYALSLMFFSIGVGGEYPMISITAMEGIRDQGTTRADKLHRGPSVALAFLMQGWGQLANQMVLFLAPLILRSGGNLPCSKTASQYTFRVSFGNRDFLGLFYIHSSLQAPQRGPELQSVKISL